MATKKYESLRIMSLEGSVVFKNDGFTATKDGKPDPKAFRGVLEHLEARRGVRSAQKRACLPLSRRQEAILPRRCEPFLQPCDQAVRVIRQPLRSERSQRHR